MTEHPDIFKKADHGELHEYSLLRETALLYTIQHSPTAETSCLGENLLFKKVKN